MNKYIAKTFQGLEAVLEYELNELGIEKTEQLNRSVGFEASFEQMMTANLCLRTALRIYMPIFEFEVEDEKHLYETLVRYDWSQHLTIDKTFSIESVIVSKQFINSHFISLKTKDAIVDFFYKKENARPNVDTRWPNIRFQIYISRTNHCVISIDTTGEPLYKRGYKKRQTQASMNECLAAGLVIMTEWNGEKDLYDMMSGSGTITAEALMYASHFPPNLYRDKWPFFDFKDFKMKDFKKIQSDLKEKIITPEVDFYVNEKDKEAYDIAKMNLFDLKVNTSRLQFSRDDFFEITPEKPGILILNPPYDERISVLEVDRWYKDLGDMLKRNYVGFDVWIISSNKSAMRKIGLKDTKRYHLMNGPLECEFCHYEMY